MNMKTLLFSLLLLPFFITAASNADMYKWKDAQGVVHYAQVPPIGQDAELIGGKGKVMKKDSKQTTRNKASDEYDPNAEVNAIIESNNALQAMAEVNAAIDAEKYRVAKENAAHCEISKSNLISLESRPIVRITENGKTRVLSYTEKTEKIKQNRKQIEEFCK